MIDDNLKDVIVAIASVITPIIVYVVGRQAKRSADKAVVAAERVESTLSVSDAQTTHKLDQITVLVDGRLTEALNKIDRLEKRLYDVTGGPPIGEPS